MSVFILETDSLMNASSSLQSLGSQVSNLVSAVEGYDVSCEDGFDFASAKDTIAGNLDACTIKIQNTACVLENVCDSHTQLQQSLKFGGGSGGSSGGSGGSSGGSGGSSGGSGGSSGSSGGSSGSSGGSSGGSGGSSGSGSGSSPAVAKASSGGSVSSGGASYSASSGGGGTVIKKSSDSSGHVGSGVSYTNDEYEDVLRGGAAIGATGLTGAISSFVKKDNSDLISSEEVTLPKNHDNESNVGVRDSSVLVKDNTNSSSKVIDNNFERVGMASVVENKLSGVSKDFFESNEVNSDAGLMMTGNRYVISCDSSIGKVGDVIKFNQDDGSVIECVVGIETKETKYKNVVNFLVSDKDNISQVDKDLCNNILEKNTKIEKLNTGQSA